MPSAATSGRTGRDERVRRTTCPVPGVTRLLQPVLGSLLPLGPLPTPAP